MSWRWSLALALIAISLFGYIVLVDKDATTSREATARAGLLLQGFDHDALTEITIARGGKTLTLIRVDRSTDPAQGWAIGQKSGTSVDAAAMQDVIGLWGFAAPLRMLGEATPDELSEFGLVSPTTSITFGFDSGPDIQISLGDKDPTGGVYAKLDSGEVAVLRHVMDESLSVEERRFVSENDAGVSEIDRFLKESDLEIPDDD